MAIARETSAAAIAIINKVKNMPSSWWGYKYLLKAIKFMLMLFSINSIDISMVIKLRREKNP